MSEPEEWEETISYKVRRREQVWKPPEAPLWQMITQHATYWMFEPGFIRLDAPWVAAWAKNGSPKRGFDGYREAETADEAVKNWPYRIATAFLQAIRTNPPVVHGASRYDHHGCRCEVCKADKAAKNKASRERKKAAVS